MGGSPPDGGTCLRLIDAKKGHGLMFHPLGNHGGLETPGAGEFTMEFSHTENPGGVGGIERYHCITLEWTDALIPCSPGVHISCPIWPFCVVCQEFLAPCEDHRSSQRHQRNLQAAWRLEFNKDKWVEMRTCFLQGFAMRKNYGKPVGESGRP